MPIRDAKFRIYNADCLKVLPTLADASIDMVCMDPPYGHNNNDGDLIHNREKALGENKNGKVWKGRPAVAATSQNPARPILNDSPEAATELFRQVLTHIPRLLRRGGCCCCCCCGGGGPDPQFARWSLWMDEALEFKQMVIWDKGPMGMGWHYRRSYETVLVAQKRGGPCKWYDTSGAVENVIRHVGPGSIDGVRKIIPNESHHPTHKPYKLAEHFIRLHTEPGDTVLDPFMGHGWTGIASMYLGRKYVGVELDPKFFAAAKEKIEKAARYFGCMIDRNTRRETAGAD